jgi:hypothetical protein
MKLKLNTLKLALSAAIVSAISMFLLPLYGIYFGKGLRALAVMSGVFPGYSDSWQGAVLGLVYGFVSCFIYVGVFAWIYNGLLDFKGIKIKAKAKPARRKKK